MEKEIITNPHQKNKIVKDAKEDSLKTPERIEISAKKGSATDDYNIKHKMGSGTFGKVFKVEHLQTKTIRAMKVVKIDCANYKNEEKDFLKEIQMLSILNHPSIIKLYEYYQDDLNCYFITEFAEGGELYEKIYEISNYQERDAAAIMEQLLSAISYMHSKGVIHRDIRLENILLETKSSDDLTIKVIGFGTANFFDKNIPLTLKVGTPYYIAPEVLDKSYSYKCDVWSCGVVMYILLSGIPPFDGQDDNIIMEKVREGKFDFDEEEWSHISDEAKDLINKMLKMNPNERIEAEDALKHPWIKRYAKLQKEDSVTNASQLEKPLETLKKCNSNKKLQQAAIAFLAHHYGSSEVMADLKNIFKEVDENGDGSLTYDEIKSRLSKFYKDKISDKEIKELIGKVNIDGNKTIEYEEFLQATVGLESLLSTKNLRVCFDSFGDNGSGMLAIEQIKKVLGVVDDDRQELMQNILNELDEKRDGAISFKEFEMLMSKILLNGPE